jgi:wyosine [tRNA(Phe)-imidazoG37] synthetase (radical SAM superfamily)
VSVLSNATMAGRPNVIAALKQVDNNILKLDSAVARTMRLINRPTSPNVLPQGIIEDLKAFGDKCIVQTMMVRGEHDGQIVDNTTDAEIDALINAYLAIKPKEIMLYSIDRKTPEEKLVKVPAEDLKRIARHIEKETGITVQVSC